MVELLMSVFSVNGSISEWWSRSKRIQVVRQKHSHTPHSNLPKLNIYPPSLVNSTRTGQTRVNTLAFPIVHFFHRQSPKKLQATTTHSNKNPNTHAYTKTQTHTHNRCCYADSYIHICMCLSCTNAAVDHILKPFRSRQRLQFTPPQTQASHVYQARQYNTPPPPPPLPPSLITSTPTHNKFMCFSNIRAQLCIQLHRAVSVASIHNMSIQV